MPPQIKRLALLFALLIVMFLTLKHFATPKTFGEFGHYRGAALGEIKAKVPEYSGQKACAECHQDMTDLKAAHEHATLSCETCHGPGRVHISSTDSVVVLPKIPNTREFCSICHTKNAARLAQNIKQIDVKDHNQGELCTKCHNPHSPWQGIK